MSFCPTKDIHSVYLDNELPEVYKKQYEEHLKNCAECRKTLAKLKATRDLFKEDVKSLTKDNKFLEDSYQRLMIKMSYNKNSKKIKKPYFYKVGYFVSAAAAVVLALFIPIGLVSKRGTSKLNPVPIDNIMSMQQYGDNISLSSGKNVVLSGNIEDNVLSSLKQDYVDTDFFKDIMNVDALKPRFTEDDIISIRITVPEIGDIPKIIGKEIPMGVVLSGNYEWNHQEK